MSKQALKEVSRIESISGVRMQGLSAIEREVSRRCIFAGVRVNAVKFALYDLEVLIDKTLRFKGKRFSWDPAPSLEKCEGIARQICQAEIDLAKNSLNYITR